MEESRIIAQLEEFVAGRRDATPPARYYLHVCFGYEVTSPIPSVEPSRGSTEGVVRAIPGTSRQLFSKGRPEAVEFGPYLKDGDGNPCGIECTIRDYPLGSEELGLGVGPTQQLELHVGKPLHLSDSSYENGKQTYVFRHFLLTEGEDADVPHV